MKNAWRGGRGAGRRAQRPPHSCARPRVEGLGWGACGAARVLGTRSRAPPVRADRALGRSGGREPGKPRSASISFPQTGIRRPAQGAAGAAGTGVPGFKGPSAGGGVGRAPERAGAPQPPRAARRLREGGVCAPGVLRGQEPNSSPVVAEACTHALALVHTLQHTPPSVPGPGRKEGRSCLEGTGGGNKHCSPQPPPGSRPARRLGRPGGRGGGGPGGRGRGVSGRGGAQPSRRPREGATRGVGAPGAPGAKRCWQGPRPRTLG